MADAPKRRAEDIKDYGEGSISNLLSIANPVRTITEHLPRAAATSYVHATNPILRNEALGKADDVVKAISKRGLRPLSKFVGLGPQLNNQGTEFPKPTEKNEQAEKETPKGTGIFKGGKQKEFQNQFGDLIGGTEDQSIRAMRNIKGNIYRAGKLYNDSLSDNTQLMRDREARDDAKIEEGYQDDQRMLLEYREDLNRQRQEGLKNPDFWSDAKMPTKIAAGIGLVLTSTLKNNTPYMALSGLINREADRQQAKFENAKDITEASGTLYGRQMQMHSNNSTALSGTRAALFDHAKTDIQGKLQGIKNQQARFNAENAMAQLDIDRDKNLMSMIKLNQADRLAKPLSAESAGKFSIALSSLEDIKNTQDNLGTIDWNILGSSEKEQVINSLTEALARGLSGAAIPETEWKRFMQWIPNPRDSQQEADKKLARLTSIFTSTVVSMDPSGRLRKQIALEKRSTISERISGSAGGSPLGFKRNQ